MQVDKPLIEIIPWVTFNKPGVKDDITAMAEKADSVMSFANEIKAAYKLSLSDATIVAKKFYKK